MKRRCHLISATEPTIKAGRDYPAICSVEVKKAAFLMSHDGYQRSIKAALDETKGLCPECKNIYLAEPHTEDPYLFVILDGELLHEPEEAA